jgi:hypothetical protein
MIVDEYQYKFGDNGVLLNADVPFIDVDSIDGLDQAPMQTSTEDYDNGHGSYLDARWYTGRTIVVKGTIYSADETLLDQLKMNFEPRVEAIPFYFRHEGMTGPRCSFARPFEGLRYSVDRLRAIGQTPYQFTLYAEDPFLYSAEAIPVGPVGLFQAGAQGGRTYPRTYPLRYHSGGGVGIPISAIVSNRGNSATPLKITLWGPAVSPRVTLVQTGQYIEFDLTLGSSDTLTIDMKNRSVILNNSASRRNKLTSDSTWWSVPALGTYRIQFTAATWNSDARMSLIYRHAYQ